MSALESWRPFIIISIALCIGTLGTALPSPLYPIYQQTWGLLPSDITTIFVAYMFGCLATILFLGRTSNSIGFVKTLQVGLFFSIIGLVLSACAMNSVWLGAGRFVIGISSGLITTAALIGLMALTPERHKSSASQLSSIVTVVGFSLGPVTGGLLGQFSKQPLVTPYIPIIIIAVLSFLSLFSLKTPDFEKQKFSIAPHLEFPTVVYQTQFWIVGLTAFGIFACFSLYASLASSFVKDVLPWHGPLVSGAAISLILFISAFSQFYTKTWSAKKSLNLGLILMASSQALLALCMFTGISTLFFISDVILGIGHGMGLLGAFAFVHEMTTITNRAAVVATYLFIGYLGTIIPIIAVGYGANHFGLTAAVIGFCVVMCLLYIGLYIKQRQLKIISSH